MVSVYFEPDKPIGPYLGQLGRIVRELGPTNIIIGGDFNAKSVWWGSADTDSRGKELIEAISEWDLQVLNDGSKPTFDTIRGGVRYKSHVDITLCSEDLLGLVEDWEVNESVVSSDHNAILFKVRLGKLQKTHINRTTRIYNTLKANWEGFDAKFSQLAKDNNITEDRVDRIKSKEDIDTFVEEYINVITKVCNDTIPKKKNKRILTLPWWSEELAALKRAATTRRRRIRCAAPTRRDAVVGEYLKAKEEYEIAAKKAQINSWKTFCAKQTKENVWDGIYRAVGRVTKRPEDIPLVRNGKTLSPEESAKVLAEVFYPEDRMEDDNADHQRTREKAECINAGPDGEY